MKEVSKKILPEYFKDVKSGIKTFEVRKDEDDIQVGDILFLEEWKPDGIFTGGYTGRCIRKRVKYVLRDIPQYGLQEGYCIIGLEDITNGWISCSERLPELNEELFSDDLLVSFKDSNDFKIAFYNGNKNKWYLRSSAPYIGEVIAWQPLPTPYQPKGE